MLDKFVLIVALLLFMISTVILFGENNAKKKKIDELEKSLITCLNKKGGFKVGDQYFICEATPAFKDNKKE